MVENTPKQWNEKYCISWNNFLFNLSLHFSNFSLKGWINSIWVYMNSQIKLDMKNIWTFYMPCDDGRYFKHLMYSIYRRLHSCFFWLKHKGYSNLILLYKLIHKSITEKLWVSFVWYTKGKGTLKKSQFLQLKVDNGSFLKKFFTLLWVSYNHISIRITCNPTTK